MLRQSLVLTAVLALGFGAAANATTVPITAGDGWHPFDVDDFSSLSGGLEWIDLNDGSPLSFSFTSAVAVVLTVVDAGFSGDRFSVTDQGNPLGTTSNAPNSFPTSIGLNFDAALASGNYSFATYLLAAGTHVITGALAVSALDDLNDPINATVGALRINAVPLPGSLLLLFSGGGLMGLIRRRRAA